MVRSVVADDGVRGDSFQRRNMSTWKAESVRKQCICWVDAGKMFG